jgi:DNA-binding CsgD family transcriptional regulator/PAS domain-containing protein
MGYTASESSRPTPGTQRLGTDAALELMGAILAATGEEWGWDPFVRRFGELMRGASPGLYLHDRDHPILQATPEYDPSWGRAYDEYYVTRDVRRPRIKALPARAVYVGQELVPDAELCRSEFYNDFLRPQHMFHALGAVVVKDEGRIGVLRVLRPRSRPFGDEERSVLQLILPHLARGLDLHQRLHAVRAERDANAEVLDAFAGGVVLLDRGARVLAANRYAETLLRAGDGLLSVHGSLIASAPRDGVLLRRLVDGVGSRDVRRPEALGGSLVVQRPSGRPPYQLLVSPLAAPWLATAPRQAAVVVYVSDPERGPEPDPAAVCRYLGLTPSEGAVVLALARGRSLAEVAGERGISLHTVRTHVKRSLAKAGVRRQADLVRLVLSGPSGLGLRRG